VRWLAKRRHAKPNTLSYRIAGKNLRSSEPDYQILADWVEWQD
jgi:hypothetical protein